MRRFASCGALGVVLILGCRHRDEWHSYREFDVRVLETHRSGRPQDYDLEEVKRAAGAYMAHLARSADARPREESAFQPYTACIDPREATQPFKFLEDTFATGWM